MQQQPAILLALVVALAGAMGLRLAWLQLVQGSENRARADENRIRLVPRNPMRGRIRIAMARCWCPASSPTTSTSSPAR